MLYIAKITFMILSVFSIRPSAFGQEYTSFGIVFALCALVIFLLERKFSQLDQIIIPKLNIIILIGALLLWMYLLIHAIIVGSNQIDNVIKATISNTFIILINAIILSHKKTNYLFFRTLIIILIISSLSYLLTVVTGLLIGDINRLKILDWNITGYENSGNIFFPFTQIYGVMNFASVQLFRAQGFLGKLVYSRHI